MFNFLLRRRVRDAKRNQDTLTRVIDRSPITHSLQAGNLLRVSFVTVCVLHTAESRYNYQSRIERVEDYAEVG